MTWSSNNLQYLNLQNVLKIDEETHIWNADLDQPVSTIRSLGSLLSLEEKKRAERFHFEKHRNRFIVCHGLLRVLLSHYIGIKPDHIQFSYGQNGKPALPEMLNNCDIRFSLSNSRGFCLFAISRCREIGVDIEFIGRSLDCDQIINNFFTEKEKCSFYCLNKKQKEKAFFKIWTKKEALLKALGIGLSLPLNSFSVSLSDHEIVELPSVEGFLKKETMWEVNVLNAYKEYSASWAIEV
jgi:4'-phosphopantetheinyl transferase